ncbi:MAG: Ppx/GppA phosphatase family protein [Bdellovibrionota bacterium]|nr:Ppx/GppA phosphatase family protein [Bdellovibrionota bacterium]
MRVACLDLGTNTFLCLIAEIGNDGFKELFDASTVVRLGQDLYSGSKPMLHPDAISRAKECLTNYSNKAKELKVDKVYAVATSAARDAENRDELFDICDSLGIDLEIIAGEREAELTYNGSFFDQELEGSLVVDVGGGSTEFLVKENGKAKAISLDVGAVRFTDTYVKENPVVEADILEMTAAIQKNLRKLPKIKKPNYLIAVAGTPTTLAAVIQGLQSFDKEKIDNFPLTKEDLGLWRDKLASLSLEDRLSLPGMQKGREDVIVAGTCILLQVLENFSADYFLVSTRGVRYGLAYEKLSI